MARAKVREESFKAPSPAGRARGRGLVPDAGAPRPGPARAHATGLGRFAVDAPERFHSLRGALPGSEVIQHACRARPPDSALAPARAGRIPEGFSGVEPVRIHAVRHAGPNPHAKP